jgi:hypothetical protein
MRWRFLMRQSAILIGIASLLCCVPSHFPIYTTEDLIFEPALLGTWSEEDREESWTISAHNPTSYRLVHRDEHGRDAVFVVHLAQISGRRFLNLLPEAAGEQVNEFHAYHLLRAHTFYLVQQIEPHLRVSYMDPEWLTKYLEEHPNAIGHVRIDDGVVLTAATPAIQEFFVEHIETPGAYSKPTDLFRAGD